MPGQMLAALRAAAPLVHCITNYVTANDCANMLLACGASPIMASAPEEAAQVAAGCAALALNMGTLQSGTLAAMLAAGQAANAAGRPVVLDPVGVGASAFRAQAARQLLAQVKFAAIRGNCAEILWLATGTAAAHGVDAAAQAPPANAREAAMALARRTGAVVAMTGAQDLVTDGKAACLVHNGRPEMRRVTGAGCQLTAMLAAYLGASPALPYRAAVAAVCAMGLCGELAWQRMQPQDGNASYRNYIIDAACNLTPAQLQQGARVQPL